MQVYIPLLPPDEVTRKGAELVEVVVSGESYNIPKFQVGCLGGIFGWNDYQVDQPQQTDFIKILQQPWPLYLVTVARHLVLQPEKPPQEDADCLLYRYILPREPHLMLSSHSFPTSFTRLPSWPENSDHSAISQLHAIAFCCLCGAYSPAETSQWLHSDARHIVKCLQNLRHARLFVPHSRYLTKHSYLHDVSVLLGIFLRSAGEEYMVTLTLCGGQQFLQEVGLV